MLHPAFIWFNSKSMPMQVGKIASRLWQAGLVHGDLSPSNIMYQDEIVKLIDLQTLHRPQVSQHPQLLLAKKLSLCVHKQSIAVALNEPVDIFN